jgi:hypothetical protein
MGSSYKQMSAMAAAQSDVPSGAVQACGSPENHEQFVLRDLRTGVLVKNRRYEITGPGVHCAGTTDADGRTQRVFTGPVPRNLKVTTWQEEGAVEGARGDWSGCA